MEKSTSVSNMLVNIRQNVTVKVNAHTTLPIDAQRSWRRIELTSVCSCNPTLKPSEDLALCSLTFEPISQNDCSSTRHAGSRAREQENLREFLTRGNSVQLGKRVGSWEPLHGDSQEVLLPSIIQLNKFSSVN